MTDTNLAARAGAWSARNWKKALFGWLVFAVAASVVGNVVGHRQMKDSEFASGEAATAITMLEQAGMTQPASESVLIQSKKQVYTDPGFQSAIAGVVQTLALQKDATNIQNPLLKEGGGGQISADGHSVLIQFDVRGDPNKAQDKIEPILTAIAGVQASNKSLSVREVGTASANFEINKTFNKDFANAERLTIPITLIDPAASRSARSSRPACRCCSPSRRCSRRSGLIALISHVRRRLGHRRLADGPPDRDGGRRRLLALLPAPRARGAGRRAPSRAAALERAAATSGRAVLISGADRDDRDGRACSSPATRPSPRIGVRRR